MEILQVAESIAREKGLSKEEVITFVENAIQVAERKVYGHDINIKAEINRRDGEIRLYSVLDVVEEVINPYTQISLQKARSKEDNIEIGKQLLEPLKPLDFKRVVARAVKQVIGQQVKEAERNKEYLEFKDKIGEIANGIVAAIEFGNIIVDLGRGTKAILLRDQAIKGESFKVNDRVKAYIQDVRPETRSPQIFLSRTDENFLKKLLEMEVPEIYSGVIEIRAIARDPGSKAKVAVLSLDNSRDAVGACIGVRGSRIKNISSEFNGERIDVVKWSGDIAQFVVNAITPAQVTKIIIDEDKGLVELILANDQLSAAIGRRGQNVRLASKLTGWRIDILTEEEESKRRSDEFNSTTNLFTSGLDVDEIVAQLLVAEGFSTMEQVAGTDLSVMTSIEGFTEELAVELKKRAQEAVDKKNQELLVKLENLGVEQELLEAIAIPLECFVKLAENGIKNLEDLEELDYNELHSLLPNLNDKDFDAVVANLRLKEDRKESD